MSINKPKVLFIDIETSPLISYTWGMYDQNIGLNQIHTDWHLLSVAWKWLGEDKIHYVDQRNSKDITDDTKILKEVWEALDSCDIVIGQNSNKFDLKKLNARFILKGFTPPSSYKKIDTLTIARKIFAFTSNKLEYLSNKLNVKHKKLAHKKFPGFELWKACLAQNKEAWKEMETYNKADVYSLEELYNKVKSWDTTTINFNVYEDGIVNVCKCGHREFKKNGFHFTSKGKYQRYKCLSCGTESRDTKNLFSKEKRDSLRK